MTNSQSLSADGGADAARAAWKEAGRDGEPMLAALGYYSLGPEAQARAVSYLRDYYAFLPDEYQEMIVGGAYTSEDQVRQAVADFERAGCDQLILFPCSPDPAQVELLAAAAL